MLPTRAHVQLAKRRLIKAKPTVISAPTRPMVRRLETHDEAKMSSMSHVWQKFEKRQVLERYPNYRRAEVLSKVMNISSQGISTWTVISGLQIRYLARTVSSKDAKARVKLAAHDKASGLEQEYCGFEISRRQSGQSSREPITAPRKSISTNCRISPTQKR